MQIWMASLIFPHEIFPHSLFVSLGANMKQVALLLVLLVVTCSHGQHIYRNNPTPVRPLTYRVGIPPPAPLGIIAQRRQFGGFNFFGGRYGHKDTFSSSFKILKVTQKITMLIVIC